MLRYIERLNDTTGYRRLEVDLERIEGGMSMAELMKIPRPSNLDDWDLHKKLEVDIVDRGRRGIWRRLQNEK